MQNPDSSPQAETWWARHRKKVFIIGGVIVLAGGGFLVWRNWDAVKGALSKAFLKQRRADRQPTVFIDEPGVAAEILELPEEAGKLLNGGDPFTVTGHIRKLHAGWTPSLTQIKRAKEAGIKLQEGETFVRTYEKNVA